MLTIYGDHNQLVGMFSGEAQDEVWSKRPETLTTTSFQPTGKARRVEGGYLLSGRWSFSSGIDYATWLIPCGVVSAKPTGAAEEQYFFLVPKSEATVIDDWHVMGLAGTGSKGFVLENRFVPAHRALSLADANRGTGPGAKVNSAPVYRLPRRASAALSLVSSAVGTAQGMLDEFVDYAKARVSRGLRVVQEQSMQLRVAEAAAAISAARWVALGAARGTMDELARGGLASTQQRLINRRDTGYAGVLACRAVDRLFAASGGSGIYLSNRLQRGFRDVHAATHHLALGWDFAATPYGCFLLGIEPEPGSY